MANHPIPEPPDGAMVLVGEPPVQVVLVRDDGSRRAAADYFDWAQVPADAHWWLIHDEHAPPLTWSEATGGCDPDEVVDDLPVGLVRHVVTRLYTQAELDAAVKAVQVTTVGKHTIESGGYCRTCGVRHSTPEIARLEDRLAEEAGR